MGEDDVKDHILLGNKYGMKDLKNIKTAMYGLILSEE